MAQAQRSSTQLIGGVLESTYGSDPGTIAGVVLPIVSYEMAMTRAKIEAQEVRGRRDTSRPVLGNKNPSGTAVVPVDANYFGWWLWMLLGAPTTTGPDGNNKYTHVFDVGSSVPSFVHEKGFTDISIYHHYNGVSADKMSLTLDASADVALTASFDLLASDETQDTTTMDAAPESSYSLAKFSIGDLALKEGGTTIAYVQSITFDEVGNSLDPNSFIIGGGAKRGSLPAGNFVCRGTMKAYFQDATLYAKAIAGTETSLQATLTSGNYSLDLLVSELMFEQKGPGIPGPGNIGIWLDLPWEAYYDDASPDKTILQATLVNDVPAYS